MFAPGSETCSPYKADNDLRASDGADSVDASLNGGTIFWSSANASVKRRTWKREQRLSVRTQTSSVMQIRRRERVRRGRLHFHGYPTKHDGVSNTQGRRIRRVSNGRGLVLPRSVCGLEPGRPSAGD